MKPLCVDLFCGLGGWSAGFLSEGYETIGFDIERHAYGEHRYPAQLVLQDVRTLDGRQFKDAAVIVASSPCQEFSYRAMPWTRARALGPPALGIELFAQAARIQREASAAAGRHIPMIQENVCGAQKYVGRAAWHYGSFYLWGDVPALMPTTAKGVKVPGQDWNRFAKTGETSYFNMAAIKNTGGSWFAVAHNRESGKGNNARDMRICHRAKSGGDGVKGFTPYGQPLGKNELGRKHGSKSSARKAASAQIAMIPFPLAQWIARVYKTDCMQS